MDGYFPSELQERFPDGVPFQVCLCVSVSLCANDVFMSKRAICKLFSGQVHDKRDEEFIFRLPWDKFPGEGKAVSSQLPGLSCKHHSVTPKNVTCDGNRLTTKFWLTGKKLSTGQFLNKLPKVVVKAGRVVDIRDSLRTSLQVKQQRRSHSLTAPVC